MAMCVLQQYKLAYYKGGATMTETWAGAILEIGLRVGLIPLNVTPWHVLLSICLSFIHEEFRKLFKELYLLYFVENFA